ncbi:MAG TPA: ABC transporter permease [Verrucomicrobiae bacterium]|nr:ABC transporter permease [Verrucomicrobiae bacterium]
MTNITQNDLETVLQFGPPGFARVVLRGCLNARSAADSWKKLEDGLRAVKLEKLEVDASKLQLCDGSGLSLLRYLGMGLMTPDAAVSVNGLDPDLEQIYRAFTLKDYNALRPLSRVKCHSIPHDVGRGVRQAARDWRQQIEFLGNVARNLLPTLWSRRQTRWPEIGRIFEQAGADAVPIVSLVSILVGLVIAFESVQTLANFGAQIYVVNMIGIIMVRELGPLLAAVLLAGRSGSAFAAELGTMKVNQELDALETFGLDPIRFLVIQRIVAAIFLTPLLTFYSTFLGILGGVLVAFALGFSRSLVYHQLTASLHLSDIFLGLAKAVAFGAIVSAVGCLRGLQTEEGPSAVGVSTTRAVVSSIVLIVIADAVFAVLFYYLKK